CPSPTLTPGRLEGNVPRSQIFRPCPLGEISMYESKNRSTTPRAHALRSLSGSRQSSKSTPSKPLPFTNTKPSPANICGFLSHALNATSNGAQVCGSVLLALCPPTEYGTFVSR